MRIFALQIYWRAQPLAYLPQAECIEPDMSQTKALAAYHNNHATQLSLEDQFPEALEHMQIALRYSYSMGTLQNKGKIYLRKGDFDESIKQFELALSVGRVNGAKSEEIADVELDLSEAFAKKGDIDKAREHFRKHLEHNGTIEKIENVTINEADSAQLNEAELEYATGLWLMQASSSKEAIECLKKSYATFSSLKVNQKRAYKIQQEIADAYMSLGQLEEARKHYRSYVCEKGTEVCALHELVYEQVKKKMIEAEVENLIGSWLSKACRYKEAIEHYRRATEFYDAWFTPYYNIAKQFYLLDIFWICVKHCKALAGLSRKLGATNEELALLSALAGDSYAKLGKLKKAVQEYRSSVQKNSLETSRKELAHLELKSTGYRVHKFGDYKNAIVFYNKSLELSPNDGELYFNIGRCYYKLKNLQQAAAYYDKSLRCDPIRFIKLNKRLSKRKWLSLLTRNRF